MRERGAKNSHIESRALFMEKSIFQREASDSSQLAYDELGVISLLNFRLSLSARG